MKKLTIFLAIALVAGLACSDQDALEDMELKVVAGAATVLRDGESIRVDDTLGLKPGDVIETKQDAIVSFALEGGSEERRGELQGGSTILIRSTSSVEAQEGNLLMRVSEPTTVMMDSVETRTAGATFRIDRGFGSDRAGVYAGAIDLDAPGQSELRLGPLYQATLVAGDLPNQERPYRLNKRDAWDQRLLEEVVSLEQELELLARGLTPQLRGQRPDLAYFRALIGGGDVGFMRSYLQRKPVDLLIGFTIARNDSQRLSDAFEESFRLFDQGARWGIAAKIMEVEPRPVVAQLERLILGTGVVAADGGGNDGADFSVAAAASGTNAATGSTDGTSTPTDPSEPPPDGGGNEKPRPKPTEDPPEECSNSAECTINEVLGQGPSPSPSPSSEDKGSDSLLDGL